MCFNNVNCNVAHSDSDINLNSWSNSLGTLVADENENTDNGETIKYDRKNYEEQITKLINYRKDNNLPYPYYDNNGKIKLKNRSNKTEHEVSWLSFMLRGWIPISRLPENKKESISLRVKYVCTNSEDRHICEATLMTAKNGNICRACAGKYLDPDFVHKKFLEQGYLLLEKYKSSKKPMKFKCLNSDDQHIHQLPWSCFNKGIRCAKCANLVVTDEQVRIGFLKIGLVKLGPYVRSGDPILCYCTEKGHITYARWARIQALSEKDSGCPYCAGVRIYITDMLEILEKMRLLPLELYVNPDHFWKMKCLNCGKIDHFKWGSIAHNFYIGKSNRNTCRSCNGGGFNRKEKSCLYYVKIINTETEEIFYKVGVTNFSPEIRFLTDKHNENVKIYILQVWEYETGADALKMERCILNSFKEYQYSGNIFLRGGGETEMFHKDVLCLEDYFKPKILY